MDARIAKIEADVGHLKTDMADVKSRLNLMHADVKAANDATAVLTTKLESVKGELKTDIAAVRVELTREIAGLRQELKGENAAFRLEFTAGIAGLRKETATELAKVKEDVSSIKATLPHLATKEELRTLEGTVTAGFARMDAGFREMDAKWNAGFKETDAKWKAGLSELESRLIKFMFAAVFGAAVLTASAERLVGWIVQLAGAAIKS